MYPTVSPHVGSSTPSSHIKLPMKLHTAHTSHIVGTSILPAIMAGRKNNLSRKICAYERRAAASVRIVSRGSVCSRVVYGFGHRFLSGLCVTNKSTKAATRHTVTRERKTDVHTGSLYLRRLRGGKKRGSGREKGG